MEMTGGCHICGRTATQSCSICGLITCDKHLKNGICSECRMDKKIDREKNEKSLQDDVFT